MLEAELILLFLSITEFSLEIQFRVKEDELAEGRRQKKEKKSRRKKAESRRQKEKERRKNTGS